MNAVTTNLIKVYENRFKESNPLEFKKLEQFSSYYGTNELKFPCSKEEAAVIKSFKRKPKLTLEEIEVVTAIFRAI